MSKASSIEVYICGSCGESDIQLHTNQSSCFGPKYIYSIQYHCIFCCFLQRDKIVEKPGLNNFLIFHERIHVWYKNGYTVNQNQTQGLLV